MAMVRPQDRVAAPHRRNQCDRVVVVVCEAGPEASVGGTTVVVLCFTVPLLFQVVVVLVCGGASFCATGAGVVTVVVVSLT
ncbi:MAG TPA: hypothetical protein VJ718_09090 [Candidatus Binataceae bacterium]|nr:hypothetical protein [Candidatus Binataceae bacterium]